MNYSPQEYVIQFEEIKVNLSNVIDAMGYKNCDVPEEIIEMVRETFTIAEQYVELRCGYIILPSGNNFVNNNEVHLQGKIFKTERIVSVPLRKMEEIAVFTATVGPGFDIWSKSTFESGDVLVGYIIDLLGSEIAESVADWIERKLIAVTKEDGKKCSNRYSPGYCGWSVSDQHQLFSFFPKQFCGISLTDTALMKPHKSVSGIIGIGSSITKMEYPCDVCLVPHCYKNREKIKAAIKFR